MGHGLVAVPRRLFQNANPSFRLRRLQCQAPRVNERLMDAITSLEELESQLTLLRQRKNGISRDHQDWIEEICEGSSLPEARLISMASHGPPAAVPSVITDRYLAEMARKLNRARHKRIRFIDTWDRLVQDAAEIQAILDASASKRLDFGRTSPHSSQFERMRVLTPRTRYILHANLLPGLRVAFAALFSLASISIVWSELVKYIAPNISIIRFTVVSHARSEDGRRVHFAGQIMASLWMCYMITAALASFGDVKVWGNRALVRRNTYGESATWYSGQIAKLTVPLAYNFLTFLPPEVHRETTFYGFLGQLINLTPLGKGFDYFFPIFILVPVCATLFNLYGRLRRIFRFDIVDEEDDHSAGLGTGTWREGRDLIERELHSPSSLGLSHRTAGPSAPHRTESPTPVGQDRQALLSNSSSTQPSRQPEDQPRTPAQQRQAQRLADATQAAEDEDENFFQGFAHRVRNTFDTIERPKWATELSKRPKWIGGVDGSAEGSGRAESGRGLGKWFGGRPRDGGVRL